jgi:hypothetical protein
MQRYAILVDCRVVDFLEGPPGHCNENLTLVLAPEGVEIGWRFDGVEFRSPDAE